MLYFLVYFVLINFLSFLVFGLDKFKARNKKWRIKENTLLFLSLVGGFLGGLLSMISFRHKTVKSSFQIKFYFIVVGWIFVFLFFLFKGRP